MARRHRSETPAERPDEAEDEVLEVDLHGCAPSAAVRKVERALHSARLRRIGWVRVITGRGLGNKAQKPILREHVAAWLRGDGGRFHGVADVQVELASGGGSLRVRLRNAR